MIVGVQDVYMYVAEYAPPTSMKTLTGSGPSACDLSDRSPAPTGAR